MMTKFKPLDLLKFCCFLIFIGTGIHHLTGNQPYHMLFEHAEFIRIVSGALLIVFGQLVLLPSDQLKDSRLSYFFLVPAMIIFVHSLCSFVQAGFVIEQLIEHSLKILLAIILVRELRKKENDTQRIHRDLKILVALTFIGHGMFAVGINYVPQSFIDMTTGILGISVDQAYSFLFVVGMLDFLFAFLLFANRSVYKVAMFYLIAWGVITAVARPVYGIFVVPGDLEGAVNAISGMIYRLPHGLIPLFIFMTAKKSLYKKIYRQKGTSQKKNPAMSA